MSDLFKTEEFGWNARRLPQERAPNDHRPFQERDRSRIIHCAAFRRLQAKTQVLGIGESDFHRTRLTHTMEVAQIGRGIVLELIAVGAKKMYWQFLPDAAQIEAICFAHDLGHPPFGHSGEIALNYAMQVSGGFEGNGQSLRIVSRMEPHTVVENSNEVFALHLTRRTLLGILKYPAPYSRVNRKVPPGSSHFPTKDWKPPKCYLDSENDIVHDWIFDVLSPSDRERFQALKEEPTDHKPGRTLHKSFDSSILELADDIAYGIHDLEDGISLKLISWNDFEEMGKDILKWAEKCDQKYNKDLRSRLFGLEARSGSRKLTIGSFIRQLIASIQVYEEAGFDSPLLKYRVKLNDGAKQFLDAVQDLIPKCIIRSQEVQTLEFRGRQIIASIFDALVSDPAYLLRESSRK